MLIDIIILYYKEKETLFIKWDNKDPSAPATLINNSIYKTLLF